MTDRMSPGWRTPRTEAPEHSPASRSHKRNDQWPMTYDQIHGHESLATAPSSPVSRLSTHDSHSPIIGMPDQNRAVECRLAVHAGYVERPLAWRQFNAESTSQVGLGHDFFVLLADEFQCRIRSWGNAVVTDDLTLQPANIDPAGDPVGAEGSTRHGGDLSRVRVDSRRRNARRLGRFADRCSRSAVNRFA